MILPAAGGGMVPVERCRLSWSEDTAQDTGWLATMDHRTLISSL
ncbi:hypothetical protein T12_4883 [Trichinella patagoniensis]|uniref:Uncharacterized protein n=1 Tax=Trichinella patagoniensis TaxID=990121 RepID=A0A0V0YQH1_9BILA|nr:hypothetical protein T12_4883 [Trichinella patagoniensis]